jgi:methylmalonyl-CoA mutase cobalamin-binding subunit
MYHEAHRGSAQEAASAAGPLCGVTKFAVQVVAKLVARDGADEAGLREILLQRLFDAVTTANLNALDDIKPEFKRARISASAMADHYIPEVARRLGTAWEEDRLSFAGVTMGVARLQAILRELGAAWSADALGQTDGPTVLVLLPQGEQHTLGTMVLAGRLRRMGVSVSLQIAPDVSQLSNFVADRSFDGAMISVTCKSRLETCRKLIKALKDATKGRLMVAIGGAILDDAEDVLRLTGADVVTNDISHALGALGISVGRSPVLELS